MKRNESGFAAVLLIVLIVLGIGALGVWRYFDSRESTTSQPSPQPPASNQPETLTAYPDYTLNIKELGLKIVLQDPPYSDITYQMRNMNVNGPKNIAALYSKDLLERNLKNCGKGCKYMSEWEKLACNKAISVYYYDPAGESLGFPASIAPSTLDDDSQIYVGFTGSCAPSENQEIFNEYKNLRDYIKSQIEKATDRKVSS